MAKHRRKRRARKGLTSQQRKFKTAVHACWADMRAGKISVAPKSLGKCMKRKL